MRTLFKTACWLAAVAVMSLSSRAATVTLANADFELGTVGGGHPITGWDEFEADGGNDDNYTHSPAGSINSKVLALKGDGGNWVGQELAAGAIDATTYGNYTVTFDYGYRAETTGNWGEGDITVRVALWNTTTDAELAGYDLLITDPNQQTPLAWEQTGHQIILSYDNSGQSAGDVLQLRFTHVSPDLDDTNWQATAMFDNIGVEGDPLNDLLVTPADGLSSSGNHGGPFTPSSVIYTLTNTSGSDSASWTAGGSKSWVSTAPASGTLAPGGTVDVTVSINSAAETLPLGSYDDTVVFANQTSGRTWTRSVHLDVSLPPGDSDGDGLPNQWEFDNGLDPYDDGSVNPDNGAWGDPDGDGLPNDEEYFMNSDPQINESGKAWQPRPEKARLMVVSAHPDDESIFFGGVYPYYTQVRQLPTVGISMTSGDAGRLPEVREAEFRNAVWEYGLRNQPIFPRFKDFWTTTSDDSFDRWADGVVDGMGIAEGRAMASEAVAYWIRRYRPDVVITHDFDGEYGHGNHKATAIAATDAIGIAADPAVDLDGLPAWQVKKLYIHNYDSGSPNGTVPLFHDHWQERSIDSDGDGTPDQTPIDTANVGSDFHVSQGRPNVSTCYASGETSSGWEPYPCEWWGLYFSTVGADTVVDPPGFRAPDAYNNEITYSGWAMGDFFEHLTTFPDSDADQLADTWELDHFVSLAAADPAADDDHDGFDNHYEFVAGLDPLFQDRTNFTIAGGSVDFTVPGTADGTGYVTGYDGLVRRYQLIYSPDMIDWSTVVAEGIADGTPRTYPIPVGQTRGFYRLALSIE